MSPKPQRRFFRPFELLKYSVHDLGTKTNPLRNAGRHEIGTFNSSISKDFSSIDYQTVP
jgi:hypothetical protein